LSHLDFDSLNMEFIRVYPRVLLTWREQGKNCSLDVQQGTSILSLRVLGIITYFPIHSILTNKPNFRNTEIDVSSFVTSKYEILEAG
jgi:hypothetical protein